MLQNALALQYDRQRSLRGQPSYRVPNTVAPNARADNIHIDNIHIDRGVPSHIRPASNRIVDRALSMILSHSLTTWRLAAISTITAMVLAGTLHLPSTTVAQDLGQAVVHDFARDLAEEGVSQDRDDGVTDDLTSQSSVFNSLDLAPHSASFYWAWFNNRQKWESLIDSQAFRELAETPMAKALWKKFWEGFQKGFYEEFPEGSANRLAAFSQSELGQSTITLASTIGHEEVFVFGDKHWSDWIDRFMNVYRQAFQKGLTNTDLDDTERAALFRQLLHDAFQDAHVPSMALGGSLSDRELALTWLVNLDKFIRRELDKLDKDLAFLRDGYTRHDVGGNRYLVLEVSANDVPWKKLVAGADEDEAKLIAGIRDWASGKTAAIGLGVHDRYLMLGFAPNAEYITSLGRHQSLIEREEMAPLRDMRGRDGVPLSSVTYLSNAFVNSGSNQSYMRSNLKELFTSLRKESNDFGNHSKLADQLESDLDAFVEELLALMPEPGAYLDFSYLTSQGIEGYVYDWTENRNWDSSRPLDILKHVNGRPAWLYAQRAQTHHRGYNFLTKWASRLFTRIRQHAPHRLEQAKDRVELRQLLSELQQVLNDLDRTTVKHLFPALADGQSALVVDFSTKSKRWWMMMPEAEQALPLPGPALVLRLENREQFKTAIAKYAATLQRLADILAQLPDADIPADYEIPSPFTEQVEGGVQHSYRQWREMGISEELAPNLTIGDEVAVFGLMPKQSVRLLQSKPAFLPGPLSDPNRSLMWAIHYDNRATIDAIERWTDYAMKLWLNSLPGEDFSDTGGHISPSMLASMLGQGRGGPLALIALRLTATVEMGGNGRGERAVEGRRQEDEPPGETPPASAQESVPEVDPADFPDFMAKLFVLARSFESYTAAGYMQNDAQVTHYLYRFTDAAK